MAEGTNLKFCMLIDGIKGY